MRGNRQGQAQFAQAVAQQLERVAKIHSAKVERLTMTSGGGAPGWSAEGKISLNAEQLPDPQTTEGLAVWIGVAMHEVGHCEWSPEAARWPDELRTIANLAEDQRQEHLVLDRLPGAVDPFKQAVSTLILRRSPFSFSVASEVWPLIAGRLYLSKKLRDGVRQQAIADNGAAWVGEVESLIAEYKGLRDPGYADYDQAVRILEKLQSLVPVYSPQDVGCSAGGSATPGVGAPGEWVEIGGEGEGEGEGGDGEGGGEGEGEGEGEGGDGAGTPTGETTPSIHELAQEELEQSRESLTRQAKSIIRRVRDDIGVTTPDYRTPHWRPPSAQARSAQRRLLTQLKPLLQAADAGLENMTGQGRIRPERLAAGYRPDQVFDKWRVDQHDDVAADIVVAVDISGSMGGDMSDLCEAIWVIRQVVSKTASRLTVLLWDHDVMEYRFPLTTQVPHVGARGSTDVTPVAKLATEIFGESRARRKWLLILTDGHSSHDPHKVKPLFAALEKSGVGVTALELHGTPKSRFTESWGVTNRMTMRSLSELPQLLGDMLRQVYRRVR